MKARLSSVSKRNPAVRSLGLTRPALSNDVDEADNEKGKTYTEKGSLA